MVSCQCAQLPDFIFQDDDAGLDAGRLDGGFIDAGRDAGLDAGFDAGPHVQLLRTGPLNSGELLLGDGGATCLRTNVQNCSQPVSGPTPFVFRPALSYFFAGWATNGSCAPMGTDPCTLDIGG